MMGIVNMLLKLPAGKEILALPDEQSAPVEAVMRNLRGEAQQKASSAKASGDLPAWEYWRLVSLYGAYVARALQRESKRRHKAREAGALMDVIGIKSTLPPRSIKQYGGSEIFRAPSAHHDECILEVDGYICSPHVEPGDFVKVDFTVDNLRGDGLYLVSIYGYLAVCGFHNNGKGWYVHESGEGMPRSIKIIHDREPEGYEVVGRVLDIYKRKSLIASKGSSKGAVADSLATRVMQ